MSFVCPTGRRSVVICPLGFSPPLSGCHFYSRRPSLSFCIRHSHKVSVLGRRSSASRHSCGDPASDCVCGVSVGVSVKPLVAPARHDLGDRAVGPRVRASRKPADTSGRNMPDASSSDGYRNQNILHAIRSCRRKPLIQLYSFASPSSSLICASLNAVGASPLMSACAEEIPSALAVSSCVVFSTAQITPLTSDLILKAASLLSSSSLRGTDGSTSSERRTIPFVLDPVGAGLSALRLETCRKLVQLQPAIIKGNAAEIAALCNTRTEQQRGIDGDGSDAYTTAQRARDVGLANENCVVVVTGEVDYVVDHENISCVRGGHAMMSSVSGTGCMLAALLAAAIVASSNLPTPLSTHKTAEVLCTAVSACAQEVMNDEPTLGPEGFRAKLIDKMYHVSLSDACM